MCIKYFFKKSSLYFFIFLLTLPALIPNKLCPRIKQNAPWVLGMHEYECVISLVQRFQEVMWFGR